MFLGVQFPDGTGSERNRLSRRFFRGAKRLRLTFVSIELSSNAQEHVIYSFPRFGVCGKLARATAAPCRNDRSAHVDIVKVKIAI
jgi:hypothetical protein